MYVSDLYIYINKGQIYKYKDFYVNTVMKWVCGSMAGLHSATPILKTYTVLFYYCSYCPHTHSKT